MQLLIFVYSISMYFNNCHFSLLYYREHIFMLATSHTNTHTHIYCFNFICHFFFVVAFRIYTHLCDLNSHAKKLACYTCIHTLIKRVLDEFCIYPRFLIYISFYPVLTTVKTTFLY